MVIIPHEVAPLLQELSEVLPKELPIGSPSMRDIQNHINFVLGAAIPNGDAYRMIPHEHDELRKQVQELLEKKLIRESMSPCVVPACSYLKEMDLGGCVSTI